MTLVLATSCGGDSGANSSAEGGVEETTGELRIGGLQAVEVTDQIYRLEGTAKNGGASNHNFHMKFELEDGSSLSFCFFCNKELSSGFKVKFTRNGEKATGTFSLGSKTHSYEFNNFDASSVIDLSFDIHNNENDIHFVLWDFNGTQHAEVGCTESGECLYNSGELEFADFWGEAGKAPGSFWGVLGNKEAILELEGPRDAKDSH